MCQQSDSSVSWQSWSLEQDICIKTRWSEWEEGLTCVDWARRSSCCDTPPLCLACRWAGTCRGSWRSPHCRCKSAGEGEGERKTRQCELTCRLPSSDFGDFCANGFVWVVESRWPRLWPCQLFFFLQLGFHDELLRRTMPEVKLKTHTKRKRKKRKTEESLWNLWAGQ